MMDTIDTSDPKFYQGHDAAEESTTCCTEGIEDEDLPEFLEVTDYNQASMADLWRQLSKRSSEDRGHIEELEYLLHYGDARRVQMQPAPVEYPAPPMRTALRASAPSYVSAEALAAQELQQQQHQYQQLQQEFATGTGEGGFSGEVGYMQEDVGHVRDDGSVTHNKRASAKNRTRPTKSRRSLGKKIALMMYDPQSCQDVKESEALMEELKSDDHLHAYVMNVLSSMRHHSKPHGMPS